MTGKHERSISNAWLIDACDKWDVATEMRTIDGIKTAIYIASENDHSKQNLLLIHGLNGSWRGMKQLGYLLKDKYNIFFVDLPGHGSSEVPNDSPTAGAWGSWARELIDDDIFAHSKSGCIDRVIAHSFGCYVATLCRQFRDIPTTFLMPVLHQSRFMDVWSGAVKLTAPITVATYNIELWSSIRGFCLCHNYNSNSWRAVRWLSRPPYSSHEQLRYQMKLMNKIPKYSLPEGLSDSVVIGEFDTVGKVSLSELKRPELAIAFPGGHMAPIEDAEDLAEVLMLSFE